MQSVVGLLSGYGPYDLKVTIKKKRLLKIESLNIFLCIANICTYDT